MIKLYDVAVVGGHGLVSKAIVNDLFKYNFPIKNLVIYGSKEHKDIELVSNGKKFKVDTIDEENIPHFDLVFFSTGEDLSYKYAPLFIKKGARVIDNSSYFRMDEKVPLVIPEINKEDLLNDTMIYANPNCTTILLLLAATSVHKLFSLEKIIVSSYQSVSGAGSLALQELINEIHNENYQPKILPSKNATKKQIFNNILPIVDEIEEDGYTKEENKIINESKKILHKKDLELNPTCVRVPTIFGHGISASLVCKEKINLNALKEEYQKCSYIRLLEYPNYPDVKSVTGTPLVDIGRLRVDKYCEFTVNLFATSDNLIRGASYNAVMIALALLELKIL